MPLFSTRILFVVSVACVGCDVGGDDVSVAVTERSLGAVPDPVPGGDPCPSEGGAMKRLPEGFCIDVNEVTRGEYFAWLAEVPTDQPQSCEDNLYEPSCQTTGAWGLDRFLERPVGCVDFCDARGFCEAHDKRLCGAIGGGPTAVDDYDDAAVDQWFAACSAGGQFPYPYGAEESAYVCWDSPEEGWAQTEVATHPGCQSPDKAYAGVFDMGGNALEWVDSCDDEGCRVRGGSYNHSGIGMKCAMGERLRIPPEEDRYSALGFRCCAD